MSFLYGGVLATCGLKVLNKGKQPASAMLLFQQPGVFLAFSDPGAHRLLSLLPARTLKAFSLDLLPGQSISLSRPLCSQVYFSVLFLAECHWVLVDHSFLPGQVPLEDSFARRYVNCSFLNLVFSANSSMPFWVHARGAEQDRSQDRPPQYPSYCCLPGRIMTC